MQNIINVFVITGKYTYPRTKVKKKLKSFKIIVLNFCNFLNQILFCTLFSSSFKCLKYKKINFSPAILKLETLLYQNIYILFHLILYSQSDFDSKKKWSKRKKNMPYNLSEKNIFNPFLTPEKNDWSIPSDNPS